MVKCDSNISKINFCILLIYLSGFCHTSNQNPFVYFQMDSFDDNTAVFEVKKNFQMLLQSVGKYTL